MPSKSLEMQLKEHNQVLADTMVQFTPVISEITNVLFQCFQRGSKLLLCGNGGSAADAQHIAAEFVNRFGFDRDALPAIALTTDSSILTCIGNDSAFENIFSRQVQAIGAKGDILVGISTSGKSANVLKALDIARTKGVITIGFTGGKGLEIMGLKCDHCLSIPSTDTARIQEAHEFIWHFICGEVESRLFQQ